MSDVGGCYHSRVVLAKSIHARPPTSGCAVGTGNAMCRMSVAMDTYGRVIECCGQQRERDARGNG